MRTIPNLTSDEQLRRESLLNQIAVKTQLLKNVQKARKRLASKGRNTSPLDSEHARLEGFIRVASIHVEKIEARGWRRGQEVKSDA